ncbi:filamentous hemagglutinin outer membrane protein [Microseira wollei NIES-4236]|uniref:Filamentous hemagglutinin outer membrane protein n=2 Tax=Microseira wollei TaxID=467598 RepID=A0AAV3XTA3_9CYAN|nr:filamentous hemagglutinin outer membrane protein [Microseira wollei NIES-4236]
MLASNRWHWRIGVAIGLLAIALDKIALAQITPDGTLGTESTIVTPINQLRDQIEGGAIRGANLFHSFREFNIGAGRQVYFANPTGIENILTRVTGSTRSEILGTLGVLGNANIFLINPNGIVFGSNARLDLRGSFLASTASSFKFADGIEFSATNPQAPPLLTINVPMGLQFGVGAGAIATNVNLTPDAVSLNVDPGRTLALVGGDLRLEGGSTLQAPGGRIELGSVGDNSFVSFTPTPGGFVLGYEGVANFRDIQLLGRERAATVSTAGSGGGNIQVQSRKLTLDGSAVIELNAAVPTFL